MTTPLKSLSSLLIVLALAPWPAFASAQSILPPPPVPVGNPQTPQKILLGKVLFWDEQLSSSTGIACGSCHILSRDGTDPRTRQNVHPGRDGIYGTADDSYGSAGVPNHDSSGRLIANAMFGVQWQVTPRRAPSVINAAYAASLFADGRADGVFRDPLTGGVVLSAGAALEQQIVEPPISHEMGHIGRTWADVANHLTNLVPLGIAEKVPAPLSQFVAGHTYASLFQQVYGTPGVTPVRIVMAIAAYERTLISDRSPFDLYLAGQGSLTGLQRRGLAVFESLCASCHSDLSPVSLEAGPVLGTFRNTGVRPPREDLGRAVVTGRTEDRGRFRVPGLRNVALRSAFFHNGSQRTLADVIDFYARGGDSADNRDPLVAAIQGRIRGRDKKALLALFDALTDPRVAAEVAPFDRPELWLEGPLVPTAFGIGSGGTVAAPPRISALGTAYLGSDVFGIGVDHIAPNLFTALMVDLFGSTAPTPLFGVNVYLGQSPALLALPMGLSQLSPDGRGYKSHVFHVPPAAASPGTYWLQWVALDPNAPFGIIASDAMRMIVR